MSDFRIFQIELNGHIGVPSVEFQGTVDGALARAFLISHELDLEVWRGKTRIAIVAPKLGHKPRLTRLDQAPVSVPSTGSR